MKYFRFQKTIKELNNRIEGYIDDSLSNENKLTEQLSVLENKNKIQFEKMKKLAMELQEKSQFEQ